MKYPLTVYFYSLDRMYHKLIAAKNKENEIIFLYHKKIINIIKFNINCHFIRLHKLNHQTIHYFKTYQT